MEELIVPRVASQGNDALGATGGWPLLYDRIVSKGLCSGCGMCTLACPHNVLTYNHLNPEGYERPVTPEYPPYQPNYCPISETLNCNFCAQACHRLDFDQPEQPHATMEGEYLGARMYGEIEYHLFQRNKKQDEVIGIYRDIIMARSANNGIVKASPDGWGGLRFPSGYAQDGGVATALACWALHTERIDGVVLASRSEGHPWLAMPKVARTVEEVMNCAGVPGYTYSPNTLALKEAVEQGLSKLAFIGLPCQTESYRRIQMLLNQGRTDAVYDQKAKAIVNAVMFTVGLFCSESFRYDGLIGELIQRRTGIDLSQIVKINIKKNMFLYLRTGEVREIPLKEAKEFARHTCHFCPDFTAELSDVAMGGLGVEGWTTAILRTEMGTRMFSDAVRDGFLEVRALNESEVDALMENLASNARRKRRIVGRRLKK